MAFEGQLYDRYKANLRYTQPSRLTEWVTENIVLHDTAFPGRFQHRVPASIGIYEAIESADNRIIVIRSPVQMMKTQICINVALFFAAAEPCPILFYEPTEELARSISKHRIKPIAMEIPELARHWKTAAIGEIKFPNGSMTILSAQGRMATKSRAAKIVIADEWRAMTIDIMGGIKARQTTYDRGGAKIIIASSAGDEGTCRISEYWLNSDRRIWHVPCLKCGSMQTLEWDSVKWEGDDAGTATYECNSCEARWSNEELDAAQNEGRYISTAKTTERGLIGFHANSLANPMIRLESLVQEWITANLALKRRGDSSLIADFQRDRMAVPWRPDQKLEPEQLDNTLRIDYPHNGVDLPAWTVALTMAVDTQDDRLEYEIVGWGVRQVETEEDATTIRFGGNARPERFVIENKFYQLRRCGVEYGKIICNPALNDGWNKILEIYKRVHPIGDPLYPRSARPHVLFVDTGGHHTEAVIRFCAGKLGWRIYPIKGFGYFGKPLVSESKGQKKKHDYANMLLNIGVNAGKDWVLAMIKYSRFAKPELKTMIYPVESTVMNRGYDLKYLGGLVSEYKGTITNKQTGQQRLAFIQRSNVANEPLDLAVYNLAAIRHIGFQSVIRQHKKIESTRKNGKNAKPKG